MNEADDVRRFLEAIRHVRLLTREEEVRLAKAIERGDEAAAKHLIDSNLRLVVSIAAKYRDTGLPLMALIEAGKLGLMRAVETFDVSTGEKFSTFATAWIRDAITRRIAERPDS